MTENSAVFFFVSTVLNFASTVLNFASTVFFFVKTVLNFASTKKSIYDFISQYHPPQTTAIYRDFKKSTAICKVYNVGLRYIKNIPYSLTEHTKQMVFLNIWSGEV